MLGQRLKTFRGLSQNPVFFRTLSLTPRQANKVATRPETAWQFAQYLKGKYAGEGIDPVEIRAISSVSLNGRPAQPLIDRSVDLAAQPRPFLRPAPWIVPLQR